GQTGAIRWSTSGGAGNWSGPAISEGLVFVGNRSGGFFAFQAETGEPVWRFQADDWATADPVVANGVVYFGTGNHENREGQRYLFALATQSGQELWRFRADSRLMTAPAVAPGKIFVGSINGTMYAIE
ncbi:MAG TPA: PQQ-binding-like beta-propeller repeat protein, partial [Acidobacteriota bacterium]|nr:PQQ-binding-like beta-propeller repeat protein [Acidobacteriota bacterium]